MPALTQLMNGSDAVWMVPGSGLLIAFFGLVGSDTSGDRSAGPVRDVFHATFQSDAIKTNRERFSAHQARVRLNT